MPRSIREALTTHYTLKYSSIHRWTSRLSSVAIDQTHYDRSSTAVAESSSLRPYVPESQCFLVVTK